MSYGIGGYQLIDLQGIDITATLEEYQFDTKYNYPIYDVIEKSYHIKPFLITNFKYKKIECHSVYAECQLINGKFIFTLMDRQLIIADDNNMLIAADNNYAIIEASIKDKNNTIWIASLKSKIPYVINTFSEFIQYISDYKQYFYSHPVTITSNGNNIYTKITDISDEDMTLNSIENTYIDNSGEVRTITFDTDIIDLTNNTTHLFKILKEE